MHTHSCPLQCLSLIKFSQAVGSEYLSDADFLNSHWSENAVSVYCNTYTQYVYVVGLVSGI